MTKTPIELVAEWRREAVEKIHSLKPHKWVLDDCANELEAALAAQWISVEDRLPKPGLNVWVQDMWGGNYVGYWCDIKNKWLSIGDSPGELLVRITHWMPIPPLLQKEKS